MFAGQNDGVVHGAVADMNPGKPSVGNVPISVVAQPDGRPFGYGKSFAYATSALHSLKQQAS